MIHIEVNNYSVQELAKLTGRSLSAFKRDFYEVFETTPHQWLLSKKIDYAEHLLKEKKMKVTKIIPLSWRFALNKSVYKLNMKNPAKALSQKTFIEVEDKNSFAVL